MQHMVEAIRADYRWFFGAPDSLEGSRFESVAQTGSLEAASFAELSRWAHELRPQARETTERIEEPTLDRRDKLASRRSIEPGILDRVERYAARLSRAVEDSRPVPMLGPIRRVQSGPEIQIRPGKINTDDARLIRLAHELKTKPISVWTRVTLSGDAVSAFSEQQVPSALERFHGTLAAESLKYWKGLIANAAQVLVSLLGVVFTLVFRRTWRSTPAVRHPHLSVRACRQSHRVFLNPLPIICESQEFFGQGGKVFRTGDEHSPSSIRSLLQPDGTLVTQCPSRSLRAALVDEHLIAIQAWLDTLLAGWRVLNSQLFLLTLLLGIALGSWPVFLIDSASVLRIVAQIGIAAAVPVLARATFAALIRRFVFTPR